MTGQSKMTYVFCKKDKLTLNFKWFWKTFNMYVTQDLLDLLGLAEYKVDGLRPPCSRLKTNKYDITIQYVVCCLLYLLYLLRNVSQFHKNKRSWSLSQRCWAFFWTRNMISNVYQVTSLRQSAFGSDGIPSKHFTAQYFSCFLTHSLAYKGVFKGQKTSNSIFCQVTSPKNQSKIVHKITLSNCGSMYGKMRAFFRTIFSLIALTRLINGQVTNNQQG